MTRAILSVSDKTGIVDLARVMAAAGVEIVSTGGTRRALQEAGVPAVEVSEYTGFPEMMDGRLKTLHPKVHGGLLALRDHPGHREAARSHGIGMIDYVVVNLYPFSETVSRPDATFEEAVENIDIGGPGMLRAAAKNFRNVVVAVDPQDYGWIAKRIAAGEEISEEERLRLAAKVFRHTGAYDARVAAYLSRRTGEALPETWVLGADKIQDLRYGENPQQRAAFYGLPDGLGPTVASARQIQGKELSYNNIQDAAAALDLAAEFEAPTAVAVKHTNPCGVAVGSDAAEAFERAREADPVSIFGGIVALNRIVDAKAAQGLAGLFLELVLAPEFTQEALEILAKKKNLRILEIKGLGTSRSRSGWRVKSVTGGLLVQEADVAEADLSSWEVVTKNSPSVEERRDLQFAWSVVRHVKSNAIVLAAGLQTLGVGAGQMNRVGAAKIAIAQAGPRAAGAVLASDAYFPLPDTVEAAAAAGVRAIVQPGGSIKDAESIAMADRHGIAMVFTHTRHFAH